MRKLMANKVDFAEVVFEGNYDDLEVAMRVERLFGDCSGGIAVGDGCLLGYYEDEDYDDEDYEDEDYEEEYYEDPDEEEDEFDEEP